VSWGDYERIRRGREEHVRPLADALAEIPPGASPVDIARVLIDKRVVVMRSDYEALNERHAELWGRIRAFGRLLEEAGGRA